MVDLKKGEVGFELRLMEERVLRWKGGEVSFESSADLVGGRNERATYSITEQFLHDVESFDLDFVVEDWVGHLEESEGDLSVLRRVEGSQKRRISRSSSIGREGRAEEEVMVGCWR